MKPDKLTAILTKLAEQSIRVHVNHLHNGEKYNKELGRVIHKAKVQIYGQLEMIIKDLIEKE